MFPPVAPPTCTGKCISVVRLKPLSERTPRNRSRARPARPPARPPEASNRACSYRSPGECSYRVHIDPAGHVHIVFISIPRAMFISCSCTNPFFMNMRISRKLAMFISKPMHVHIVFISIPLAMFISCSYRSRGPCSYTLPPPKTAISFSQVRPFLHLAVFAPTFVFSSSAVWRIMPKPGKPIRVVYLGVAFRRTT